jgi:hypothetical protein
MVVGMVVGMAIAAAAATAAAAAAAAAAAGGGACEVHLFEDEAERACDTYTLPIFIGCSA